MLPQAERAGTPNEEIADTDPALEFVDGLATQAYETLNDQP